MPSGFPNTSQQIMPVPGPLRLRPKRRWRSRAVALFILAFIAINALAFVQAWSMTHFSQAGTRTPSPESLSLANKIGILLTGVHVPRPVNDATPAAIGQSFATVHLPTPSNDAPDADLELWFIPAAPSPPRGVVLMYHGYASSKSTLLPQAREFHQLGYDVLMVDFRGSGGSSGNSTTIGYREADDVAATFQYARNTRRAPKEPIMLYGQSMGAAAILRAVGDLNLSPNAIILESVYDRLLSTAENRFHAMNLPAFPAARMLIFYGGLQQGYWAFNMNPAESATRVHCPVLLFNGQLDPRVTPDQARSVYDHLAGPKRLEWYDTAGHCEFLSSNPPRWRRAVEAFLATP